MMPENGSERAQTGPFWELVLVLLVALGWVIVYAAGVIL